MLTILPNVAPVYSNLTDQLFKENDNVLADLTAQWTDATPATTLTYTS